MTWLYEVREVLIKIYKRYEIFIMPILKFIFGMIVFSKLNNFMNFENVLNHSIVTILLATLFIFVPGSWLLLIIIFLISSHLFLASLLEATVLLTLVMLVVYLMYIRIFPKMGYLIIAVPLFFSLGIPYVLPIFAGIFLGHAAVIPIAIGIGVYFFSGFLPVILDVKSESIVDMPDVLMNMYKLIMESLLNDSNMILTIFVFIAVILITYLISRLEFEYIAYIAIVAGGISNIFGFIIGNIVLKTDIGIGGIVLGSLFGIIVVAIIQFFKIALNYSRAEKVQFEDDEYFYYVKAIPKIVIGKPEKKIKKIK